MLLPNNVHGIQGNSFGLRQKKQNKDSHHKNPTGIEQKSTKLEVTKHCQESLGQDEGDGKVDRNANALSCSSNFHWEYFTRNEPNKGSP